jgi:3',5'-cyclic AMP phosphodiesterase CpdA
MRIAHLSDLHLVSAESVPARRLLNKRFTGWVNLKLRRGQQHVRRIAQAVAREVAAHDVDHVVITGDVTNLALEAEFELVRSFLEGELRMAPDQVSVVPGNHDTYTRGAYESRRFQCYLGEYITSDLPGASCVPGIGRFPYVRLRGPVAIIGLSSAVPRLPLVAAGQLGHAQTMALHALLAHVEVARRLPILVQHHPWHPVGSGAKNALEGLRDAAGELAVLEQLERGMLLHGHLHRRIHRTIPTARGRIDAIGSTSASLLHDDLDRVGGFNLYDVGDDGTLTDVSAWRWERDRERLVPAEVPRV